MILSRSRVDFSSQERGGRRNIWSTCSVVVVYLYACISLAELREIRVHFQARVDDDDDDF